MQIKLSDVGSVSLTAEMLQDRPAALIPVPLADKGRLIYAGQAEDVLYLPGRRLQIVDNCSPLEATPYPSAYPELLTWMAADNGPKYLEAFEPDSCDEDVCILNNIWSNYFYHFIEECLKVVCLERIGFRGKYVLSDMPSFAMDYLDLLDVPRDRIKTDVVRPTIFKRAWFVTPVGLHGDFYDDPHVMGALRDALLGKAETGFTGPERLWLERGVGAQNRRHILNQGAVADLLNEFGFESVDMAKLPAARQIAYAKNAKIAGGAHGAAMIHALFMRPGATLIECFSPQFINPSVMPICKMLKLRYFQIVPNNAFGYKHGREVAVPAMHLRITLESACQIS